MNLNLYCFHLDRLYHTYSIFAANADDLGAKVDELKKLPRCQERDDITSKCSLGVNRCGQQNGRCSEASLKLWHQKSGPGSTT